MTPDLDAEAAEAPEAVALVPAPTSVGSRDKILDVGESLFALRGYSGVGLREVAERVGLGKSSLFHHFGSKGSLYLSVLQRVYERIEDHLGPSIAAGGPPADRLDRAIDALIDVFAENPATARLLLRGLFEEDEFPPRYEAERERARRPLERVLQRVLVLLKEGTETGAFRPASPPHVLQTVIGAVVYHFASRDFGESLIGAPLFSSEAVRQRRDEVKQMLRRGLAPEPAPAG